MPSSLSNVRRRPRPTSLPFRPSASLLRFFPPSLLRLPHLSPLFPSPPSLSHLYRIAFRREALDAKLSALSCKPRQHSRGVARGAAAGAARGNMHMHVSGTQSCAPVGELVFVAFCGVYNSWSFLVQSDFIS